MEFECMKTHLSDKTAATFAKATSEVCVLNTQIKTYDENRKHKGFIDLRAKFTETMKTIHNTMDMATFSAWTSIEDAFSDGMVNRVALTWDSEKKTTAFGVKQVVFDLQAYLDYLDWASGADEAKATEFAELVHTATMAVTAFTFNSVYYDNDGDFDHQVYDMWTSRFGAFSDTDSWGRNATERAVQAVVDYIGLKIRITKTSLLEMATFGNVISYSGKNVLTMATDSDMLRILTIQLVHMVSGKDWEVLKKHSK